MEQQLEILKQKMVQDYNNLTDNVKWQKKYADGIYITEGRKYYKVMIRKIISEPINFSSVDTHSFIVKQDCGNLRKGDILKPASYRQPATNFSYGNILQNFVVGAFGAI